MLIVDFALLVIVKNLVRLLNRLELDFRSWALIFGDFVRVVGESSLITRIVSVTGADQRGICHTFRYACRISSLLASRWTSRTSVGESELGQSSLLLKPQVRHLYIP